MDPHRCSVVEACPAEFVRDPLLIQGVSALMDRAVQPGERIVGEEPGGNAHITGSDPDREQVDCGIETPGGEIVPDRLQRPQESWRCPSSAYSPEMKSVRGRVPSSTRRLMNGTSLSRSGVMIPASWAAVIPGSYSSIRASYGFSSYPKYSANRRE